ncbi:MAG: dual specificity protein phosphatase family protein, partial [Betaproteobacteria bacterium]
TLAQIKNFVDNAHQQDGKVLIHCGAGAGRTGTVLASLVLADLVKQERARKPDYSVADAGQNIVNVEVEYSHDHGDDEPSKRATTIPVPKILADAINIVRQADQDTAYKDQSVETDFQVGALMNYLAYLLGKLDIDGKSIR